MTKEITIAEVIAPHVARYNELIDSMLTPQGRVELAEVLSEESAETVYRMTGDLGEATKAITLFYKLVTWGKM